MTASRLPIPGQDKGTWGDVLNNFLEVSHAADGTLNSDVIGATQIKSNSVTAAHIADGTISSAKLAVPLQQAIGSAIQTVNGVSATSGAITLAASDIGAVPITTVSTPAQVGLLWQDEFTEAALDLATDTGGGVWRTRPREAGAPLSSGYGDYAGSSYNVNYSDAVRLGMISIANSVLSLKAVRADGSVSGTSSYSWYSVTLSTNHLLSNLVWSYGYVEFRMRLPVKGRGMFPALWMFNADPTVANSKSGAEIDIFEVFGNPTGAPWQAGVHYNNGGLVSNSSTTGDTLYTSPSNDDTTGWHRYGLDWQADHITLYKDGTQVATLSRSEGVQWFNGAKLGLRMDIEMDPNWLANGDPNKSISGDPAIGVSPQMDIDYVRVYSKMPTLPVGSDDPLASATQTSSTAPSRRQVASLVSGEQPDAARVNALIANDANHENRLTNVESPYQTQSSTSSPIKQYTAIAGATSSLLTTYNASGNLKFELSPDGSIRADGTYLVDPTAQNGSGGVYIGQKDGTRRIIFHDGTPSHAVQIDNNGGTARLIVNGVAEVSVSTTAATFNVPKISYNQTITGGGTLGTPLRELYFLNPSTAITITVPAGAAGQLMTFINISGSTVTLTPSSGTIQTTSVASGATVRLASNGTNWYNA